MAYSDVYKEGRVDYSDADKEDTNVQFQENPMIIKGRQDKCYKDLNDYFQGTINEIPKLDCFDENFKKGTLKNKIIKSLENTAITGTQRERMENVVKKLENGTGGSRRRRKSTRRLKKNKSIKRRKSYRRFSKK